MNQNTDTKLSSGINYHKIDIYQLNTIIQNYLLTKHPKHSNGFVIRILDNDNENCNYERRRSYIVTFPQIGNTITEIEHNTNEIVGKWSEYAIINVIENYNYLTELSLLSIDPINVSKNIDKINIQFSGSVSNPEILIRNLTLDVINQMNKHLIEYYMDKYHPNIDITNSEELEEFNEKFDEIDMESIYELYPYAEVYVPIEVIINGSNKKNNQVFYINGIISTTMKYIDIIDDIRSCLDFNYKNEILKYCEDEIIYKFCKNKNITPFEIITEPDI